MSTTPHPQLKESVMRINIIEIYRIETQNSTYEIRVHETVEGIVSVCKKMPGGKTYLVKAQGTEYLEKLVIGPSFNIPGVALTSRVQDFQRFVLSTEPKRVMEKPTTIGGFFEDLATHVKEQANPKAVLMAEPATKKGCKVPGCTYSAQGGPSHDGSRMCKSGSIASGGTRAHCSCDFCF